MFTGLSRRVALHQCLVETYCLHRNIYLSGRFGEAVKLHCCLVRILARSPDDLIDFFIFAFSLRPCYKFMLTFEAIHHKCVNHTHNFYSSMTTCFGQLPSQNVQNNSKYSANIIHTIYCQFLNVL